MALNFVSLCCFHSLLQSNTDIHVDSWYCGVWCWLYYCIKIPHTTTQYQIYTNYLAVLQFKIKLRLWREIWISWRKISHIYLNIKNHFKTTRETIHWKQDVVRDVKAKLSLLFHWILIDLFCLPDSKKTTQLKSIFAHTILIHDAPVVVRTGEQITHCLSSLVCRQKKMWGEVETVR